MKDATRTFSAYETIDRRKAIAPAEIYDRLAAELRAELRAAGWRDRDVDELTIDLSISGRHEIHVWQDASPIAELSVVLAETRALVLLDENPFPYMSFRSLDGIEGFLLECLGTIDALFGWLIPSRRKIP